MTTQATRRKSDIAGKFQVIIDHDDGTPAWVKSVSGGDAVYSVIDERTGVVPYPIHHLAPVVEFAPIEFELAMGAGSQLLGWLQDTWRPSNSNGHHRTGAICFADFNSKIIYEKQFYGAVITKVTFPALDASSADPGYLGIQIHPEDVKDSFERTGHRLQAQEGRSSMKAWSPNNFRVSLFGADGSIDCTNVKKVQSFSITHKYASLYTGGSKFPERELSSIEYPTLTMHMPLSSTDELRDWYVRFGKGQAGPGDELQGTIEFLDQSCDRALFTVDLDGVGICGFEVQKSDASAPAIKQAKIQLYVDTMSLRQD